MITVEVAIGGLVASLEKLDSPEISEVKLLLLTAKKQLNLYSEVWNSIYWKNSRAVVKKRVRSQLNNIARMAYDNLCEVGRILKEYEKNGNTLPESITAKFTLIYYDFCTGEAHFLPDVVPREYAEDNFNPLSKIRLITQALDESDGVDS